MLDPLMIAQASSVDPGLGVSIASLVSSLSAAGAAVVVTYYFLGFLKERGEDQKQIMGQFRGYHAESQRKFQDQIDRLADRQSEAFDQFRAQVGRVTETQNAMLKDAITTMKSIEKTLDVSSTTIQGIETTVGSLQRAVGAIDAVMSTPEPESQPRPLEPREPGASPI